MGEVDWIPRLGVLASLAEIGAIFPGAMAQNWAAAGCAVLALAAASRPRGRRAVTIALLLGSAIAATALVLAINAVKPIVVQRYFSFVFVECACALAVLIAPWLDSHRRVAWLAPLNAAAFLLTYGVTQAHKPLWERGAEQVAAIVRACPTARVRGGSRPEDPRETLGLTYLGRRHGFKVLPVAPDAPDDCPVLYWTEQNAPTDSEVAVFAGNLARAANAKAGYQLPEALLSAATAERTNNGAIIIVGARAK